MSTYPFSDGSEPSKEKSLYTNAIKLTASDETKLYVIKAKAFYDDGTKSDTVIHSYFIGKNVKSRFDTLVFSITSDPYNLYDNEHGILVEGKLRQDYVAKHPTAKLAPESPANYNIRGKESEREACLEVFEPDGTKVIGQQTGIRVYGGASRALPRIYR